MQAQIHPTSRSVPFYLPKSATWSPSSSIKSAGRNCREQHCSVSLKSPFSSLLSAPLLPPSEPAAQLSRAAGGSPDHQRQFLRNGRCRCHWKGQLFLSVWRVTKLLKVVSTKPERSFVLRGKSQLPHSNTATAPLPQQATKHLIFTQESRFAPSFTSHAQAGDVNGALWQRTTSLLRQSF